MNLFDLTGKTALVTGCNRGIGKAMAEGLAEAGADIIGVSGSMPLSGSSTQLAIEQLGRRFFPYQCDFSDRTSLYSFIEKVQEEHPVIDILVNNVGISSRGNLADLDPSVLEQVFKSNVFGTIYPTQAALPALRESKGSIVFISSLAGIHGLPGLSPYSASKMPLGLFLLI